MDLFINSVVIEDFVYAIAVGTIKLLPQSKPTELIATIRRTTDIQLEPRRFLVYRSRTPKHYGIKFRLDIDITIEFQALVGIKVVQKARYNTDPYVREQQISNDLQLRFGKGLVRTGPFCEGNKLKALGVEVRDKRDDQVLTEEGKDIVRPTSVKS